jgi:hypothetical protein
MGAVANYFWGSIVLFYAFNSHNNLFKVGFKGSIINLTEKIKVLYAVVLDTR